MRPTQDITSSTSPGPSPKSTYLIPTSVASPFLSTSVPTPAPAAPRKQVNQYYLAFPPGPHPANQDWISTGEEDEDEWGIEKIGFGVHGSGRKRMKRQQNSLPVAAGYPDCNYVGNAVLSCYPESNTTLVQGIWSKFIWAAQYPTFIGAGQVDIYLYHADSETLATLYLNISNARGMIGILPDDQWFPTETSWEAGHNLTWPYYFLIVDHGAALTGGEQHQATFSVIQTAAPATLSSSYSGSSTAAGGSATPATTTGTSGSSSLQPSSSSSHIPTWAIALLVVFGVLALVASIIAAYLCIGNTRTKRRAVEEGSAAGSSEPMLSRDMGGRAGLTRAETAGGVLGRTGAERETPRAGLSSSDAEIMAEAFRRELRGPTMLSERRESGSTG